MAQTPPLLIRPGLTEAKYSSASNLTFNERIKLLMKQGNTIYHFGFGQAPFPVLEVAVEALHKHVKESACLAVQGIPHPRHVIRNFHKQFHSIDFDPENVIAAPGSKELILLLTLIFNGAGMSYAEQHLKDLMELRSVGVRVVEPTSGYYIFPNFGVIRAALAKKGIETCEGVCEQMLSEISVALFVTDGASGGSVIILYPDHKVKKWVQKHLDIQ